MLEEIDPQETEALVDSADSLLEPLEEIITQVPEILPKKKLRTEAQVQATKQNLAKAQARKQELREKKSEESANKISYEELFNFYNNMQPKDLPKNNLPVIEDVQPIPLASSSDAASNIREKVSHQDEKVLVRETVQTSGEATAGLERIKSKNNAVDVKRKRKVVTYETDSDDDSGDFNAGTYEDPASLDDEREFKKIMDVISMYERVKEEENTKKKKVELKKSFPGFPQESNRPSHAAHVFNRW